MEKMLEHALSYARRGWHILPMREKDGVLWQDEQGVLHLPKIKTPYVKFGVNAATTDEAQIRQWWSKWPYAAVAVNCGKSGLFALDLDCKDGRNGWAYYRDRMRDYFPDDGAFHTITPTGGIHIIYSGEGQSSTNVEIGVDTRGRGGALILPPSEIEGRGDYFQCDDWSGTPAPIPAGLLNFLFPPKEQPKKAAANYPDDPDNDYRMARLAVQVISVSRAQNYDDKVRIGMALTKLGDSGLQLWQDFCKRDNRPGKYDAGELEQHWRRIQTNSVTLGTLFYYANQDAPGWRKMEK